MATTDIEHLNTSLATIAARTDSAGSAVTDFSAEELRELVGLFNEGVVGTDDWQVVAGAGATMNVVIGSGTTKADKAVVAGDNVGQGSYLVRLDETTKTIALDNADGSNPRKDEIYLVVADQAYDIGSLSLPYIGRRTGTAAAIPTAPGPDSAWEASLLLATIDVPAGAADITECTITDERPRIALKVPPIAVASKTTPGGTVMTPTFGGGVFLQFTPPAGWGTYRILASGSHILSGTGEAEARIEIDGQAGDISLVGTATDPALGAAHSVSVSGSVSVYLMSRAPTGTLVRRGGFLQAVAYPEF